MHGKHAAPLVALYMFSEHATHTLLEVALHWYKTSWPGPHDVKHGAHDVIGVWPARRYVLDPHGVHELSDVPDVHVFVQKWPAGQLVWHTVQAWEPDDGLNVLGGQFSHSAFAAGRHGADAFSCRPAGHDVRHDEHMEVPPVAL